MTERVRPTLARWPGGRIGLGLLLSAACLALALYDIDLSEVGASLRAVNLAWLGAALLLAVAGTLAKAIRWRLLLQRPTNLQPAQATAGRPALPISLARLTRIWLAGASLNLALPAPRSGDLARAYLAGEAGGISKSLVLGTVAAEKLLDIVMLAVCFLALVSFVALPDELVARQGPVIALALFFIMTTVIVLWQRDRLLALARWFLKRLPKRWSGSLLSSTERAVQGLDALRYPRTVLWLLLWSAAIWIVSAAINNTIFLALGLSSSWVQSFFVLVVLQAGVAIPSSPGKVGVFQVLCRWALMFFGYSAATGLAYGVLLYLVAPIFYMVVGAIALLWESWHVRQGPGSLDQLLAQGRESLSGSPQGSLGDRP